MPYFRKDVDQRSQVFLNLSGSIESQLRDAYAKLYERGEETQAGLARKLDVNRSAINHRLSGHTNMTVKTLADMVWVLRCCIDVDIYDPADRPEINHPLALGPLQETSSTGARYVIADTDISDDTATTATK